MIYDNNQVAFKYHKNNPNGSVDNIAGIYSQNHRILGLMPHPERRVSSEIGLDGERLFRSLIEFDLSGITISFKVFVNFIKLEYVLLNKNK